MEISSTPDFSSIRIILKNPCYPENIGSSARAMCNMGLTDLALVSPAKIDIDRVKRTATHEAETIVDNISRFDSVEDAIADCSFVAGTTARLGRNRVDIIAPSEAASELTLISGTNQTAILFGPEDRGLQNSDIALCDMLIHISTNGFTSINLAQSVMIICYELCRHGVTASDKPSPRLAGKHELSSMYTMLGSLMEKTGYTNPENPTLSLTRFRRLFSRVGLRAGDVVIIKGFLKKILASLNTEK